MGNSLDNLGSASTAKSFEFTDYSNIGAMLTDRNGYRQVKVDFSTSGSDSESGIAKTWSDCGEPQSAYESMKKNTTIRQLDGVTESKRPGQEMGGKNYVIKRIESSKKTKEGSDDPTVLADVVATGDKQINTNWSYNEPEVTTQVDTQRISRFSNSSTEAPMVPPKTREAYEDFPMADGSRNVEGQSGDGVEMRAYSLRQVYSNKRQSSSGSQTNTDIQHNAEKSTGALTHSKATDISGSDPETFKSSGYGSYSSMSGGNGVEQRHKDKPRPEEEKENFRDSIRELDEYLKSQPGGESDTESVKDVAGKPLKFSDLQVWHF